jgi:hypothetical protein
MKGNKLIFSKYKRDRIKGYRKLLKEQDKNYQPPNRIARGIVEAMEAQGYSIKLEQAIAYMKASYAVFDKDYYERSR